MKESGSFSSRKTIISTFLLCFVVVGIPFWQTPYSSLSVPNSFFGIGIIAVFSTAVFLAFRFGLRKGLFAPGFVFPAVLMSRVFVEGIMEPSRHNLWPLALIIAAVLGLMVAGSGAALGWLASKLLGRVSIKY